jgi:uncharacterized protein (DUF1697 family)
VAQAVFLRAMNVGGRALKPKALATELGLVNLGAAGTFVAPEKPKGAALARAIQAKLSLETEIMVCPGREILELVASEPFGRAPLPAGTKGFVTVLAAAPSRLALPLEKPAGARWEVRVVAVTGRYALSLRRRLGPRTPYPNEVIERELGIAATTRGWETILSLAKLIGG